jgi:hypothetical protein
LFRTCLFRLSLRYSIWEQRVYCGPWVLYLRHSSLYEVVMPDLASFQYSANQIQSHTILEPPRSMTTRRRYYLRTFLVLFRMRRGEYDWPGILSMAATGRVQEGQLREERNYLYPRQYIANILILKTLFNLLRKFIPIYCWDTY